MQPLLLIDIVDIQKLQELQDSFSEVTNLAMVIVDYNGNPLTRYSNFTEHCKYLRRHNLCRDICFKSDAYAGLIAMRNKEPFIHRCHAGLVDVAIPIVFEDQMLGSILAGQVRVTDSGEDLEIIDEKFLDEYELTESEKKVLENLYEETPIISSRTLLNSVKMIDIFSNYIVEMGVTKLTQEELDYKNQKLEKEMQVRVSLEKSLRESEINILKSQINPHFLFNVLNNINNLAIIEDAPKTSEMVYSFAEMLRYTTKNDATTMVKIEEELNYTKQYLKIQQLRFGDKLNYNLDIDESLLDVKCPFMVLHPLVANSIDHGLFRKEEEGKLDIKVYGDREDVIIEVYDNGIGMTEEKIDSILNGNSLNVDSKKGMGIGLISLDKRLVHQYGKDYRLNIESEVGKFTRVRLKVKK